MKRQLNNIRSSLILCVCFIFSASVYAQTDVGAGGIRTVVIDAGHGGKDPGCHGKHSNEKTVTLGIALILGQYIEKNYPDIKVVYTRKTDVFVELDERAQIANRNKADLFICIHANAGPEAAFGAETYVLGLHRTEAQRKIAERENAVIEFEEGAEKNYEKLSADMIIARQLQLSVFLNHSIEFASRLQGQFVKLGRHDRGVRQAGFLVLYKTTMPSVLIETGFLTNAKDENFLADTANQRKMAESMFTAFEDYKEYYELGDQSSGNVHGMSEDEVKADDILFRVQILTSATELEANDPSFQGNATYMYEDKGLFKYTVGLYKSVDDANELKKEMRAEGFEHAFVVAFKNGERINLDEAIKLSQN